MKPGASALAGLCFVLIGAQARATEDGASSYPQGPDYHLSGVLQPPGDYFADTANAYTADHANGSSGNRVTPPDFRFTAIANIFAYVHVTEREIFGANWGMRVTVPVVYNRLRSAGRRQSRFGVANITLSPFLLGWHRGHWHWIASPDANTPDFNWKPNRLNAGQGYWNISPTFAFSYWDPVGPNGSLKLMYDYNFRNPESGYASGQELHFDFEAGWQFGKINIGPSGYYDQQTTDDILHGVKAGDGNRGMVFAAGPTMRYNFGNFELEGAWHHEFMSENRTEGEKVWLRAHFAL